MATRTLLTAEEFLVHPAARERSELVRGEIRVMSPAGGAHGWVVDNAHHLLSAHVRANRLGKCFTESTGFRLPIPGDVADTVRAPDVSFVRADRLPPGGFRVGDGFVPLAPDLAVEVLSPSESASESQEKVADYLAAGTRLLWVVDPERRRVAVHSPTAPTRWLREGDTLDGGDVVPGLSAPVAALFEGLARDGDAPPA